MLQLAEAFQTLFPFNVNDGTEQNYIVGSLPRLLFPSISFFHLFIGLSSLLFLANTNSLSKADSASTLSVFLFSLFFLCCENGAEQLLPLLTGECVAGPAREGFMQEHWSLLRFCQQGLKLQLFHRLKFLANTVVAIKFKGWPTFNYYWGPPTTNFDSFDLPLGLTSKSLAPFNS